MEASLVRLASGKIDIKVVNGDRMHILQWRRGLLNDEVLLDGKTQQISSGLWGRETIYGLVFGRNEEGEGGFQVMLIIDPSANYNSWTSAGMMPSGVRLETVDGPLLTYGTLDERAYDRPADFRQWAKQKLGIKW